jgi:hypothetical protein
MREQRQPVTRRPAARLVLSIAAVALGLAIVGFYGMRAVRSFRELQYIRQQGLDRGTASVDAIRPWMTIRFIAVAYAVPEEYLYSALGIPFDRRNAHQSLGELNRIYHLGHSPIDNELAIVGKAQSAIADYRANPVATGLRDVRPWMSIRYIANSTGVPADYIAARAGVPLAGNQDKPLDLLSDEQRFRGGPRALVEAIVQALAAYERQP